MPRDPEDYPPPSAFSEDLLLRAYGLDRANFIALLERDADRYRLALPPTRTVVDLEQRVVEFGEVRA